MTCVNDPTPKRQYYLKEDHRAEDIDCSFEDAGADLLLILLLLPFLEDVVRVLGDGIIPA